MNDTRTDPLVAAGTIGAAVLISLALAAEEKPAAPGSEIAKIREEARALAPLATSDLAKRFLEATQSLPSIEPRTLYRDASKSRYFTKGEAAAMPEAERKTLEELAVDEAFYYKTRYGTPLAYARPLDLLASRGLTKATGARILDFGYGSIGQLLLLASLGARAVGVEVDPLLRALYAEAGDQGAVKGSGGPDGSVTLLDGHFPADERIRSAAGDGYDLFISKNVLKNGYIHPAEPVDPKRLVHLEVDDAAFVKSVHAILKPGGLAMIYNLCPAPAPPGKPYIPWADGRSPFSRSVWESAGFKVLAFDEDDSKAARAMARALGWDKGPGAMDPDKDLFATYTLVKKP